jgi:glucose/arabinose dehydrogenase
VHAALRSSRVWTAILLGVLPALIARTTGQSVTPLTRTFQISNYVDDVNESASEYDEFSPTVSLGTAGSAANSYTGLRFSGVSIPRGSVIRSAHLEAHAAQTSWILMGFEIGIEASGNSAAFSTGNRPSQRALATPRVAHSSDVEWIADTWYSLDDITPLVQAIVNRSDWSSGNSLSLVLRGTVGTWGRKLVHSFDQSGSLAPRLVVTFEPGLDSPPPPPPPTSGFQNTAVFSGIPNPTFLTFTPDQRMLVAERGGRVRVALPGATVFEPTPFLQLQNIEAIVGERSLISLVLDPNFASNGRYYVFYTAANPLRDRVSRFTASGNTTNLSTEVVIWQDIQDSSDIHHGGGLVFGGDGKLYIGTGDAHDTRPGASHNSQILTAYNGKILRVNPDGTVPSDNPFNDGAGPNLDAIWARGFRNPFRMIYDQPSDRLYVFDVGGGSWEEIDVATRGANYGWPTCEGPCMTGGVMTNPLFAYSHNGSDAAIGGGVVYRGTQFPAEYFGDLFYGDYVQQWIRRLEISSGTVSGDFPVGVAAPGTAGSVVQLTQGPDGAIYYTDIGGSIRRISYFAGNAPPVISSATASPTQGDAAPLKVSFTAVAIDPEGQSLTYTWEFGDGTSDTGATTMHDYLTPGQFSARVMVSDGVNTTFSTPLTLVIGTRPVATITAPPANISFSAGDVISFSGTASDPNETLGPQALSWSIVFHHDTHTHPAYGPISGASGTFAIPTTGHDFSGNTRYEIILTATDSQGLQDTASVFVFPRKLNLTLQSVPAGLQLSLDQTTQAAPLTKDTLAGFTHLVTAPTRQTLAGRTYDFVSWSDGGAAIHSIVAPANSTTLVATYRDVTGSPGADQSLTLQVASGNDDVNEEGTALVTDGSVWIGNGGAGASSYTGLRFTNVAIPSAASIVSAQLEVYSPQSQWIQVAFETAAEAAASSAPFMSASRPSQRSVTAARVAHSSDVLWNATTWYRFDEIAPIIQSIVSRSDWRSGNSLSLILRGTGATWGRKFVQSGDLAPANAPRLVIRFR